MLKEKIAEAQTEDGSILGAEFEKEELLEEDTSSLDFEEIHFGAAVLRTAIFQKPPFIKFHLRMQFSRLHLFGGLFQELRLFGV